MILKRPVFFFFKWPVFFHSFIYFKRNIGQFFVHYWTLEKRESRVKEASCSSSFVYCVRTKNVFRIILLLATRSSKSSTISELRPFLSSARTLGVCPQPVPFFFFSHSSSCANEWLRLFLLNLCRTVSCLLKKGGGCLLKKLEIFFSIFCSAYCTARLPQFVWSRSEKTKLKSVYLLFVYV